MCSPIAIGQTSAQTPPKVQIGYALQILSPTRGADFSGYIQDLMAALKRDTIASLPDSVKSGETAFLVVIVQVRADGTFLNPDPKITRSSNRAAIDAAPVAAVRASAPFPHFPSAFEGATIELKISFFYNIRVKKPDPILVPGKSDAGADSPK
jgi:outer membrane biosynthesis protein TonB